MVTPVGAAGGDTTGSSGRSTVADAPRSRVFYECYRDRAAFDEHERQPHTRHFLTEREAWLASSRVEFLTPTASAR